LVIQWCRPEPDFKCIPLAKALERDGHQVQVLTGFPNYPGGVVYKGYRVRWNQREIIDGIDVLRVPLYPSHSQSAVGRALNYASFGMSSAVLGAWRVRPADIAFVYNPQGLPGITLKWFRGIPFVFDIQDLWPDSLGAAHMVSSRFLLAPVALAMRFFYHQAARICVLSDGFKRVLCERGVPEEKIAVVYNWADESVFFPREPDPELSARFQRSASVNLVYAGNMGRPQALDVVLDAARRLRADSADICFHLMGRGTERVRLERAVHAQGLENVRFLASAPAAEAARVLASADALFVHLAPQPLFEITIPSKIQSYMAMRRPLIAGVSGDAANLVRRAGCGIVFEPGSGEQLAVAARQFAALSPTERASLGAAGRDYYERNLSLRTAAKRYQDLFSLAHR
jgi:glycosyltransferase involved in cell wall biosynthesis